LKKENTRDVLSGNVQGNSSYENSLYAGTFLYYENLILLAKRIEICPFSKKPPPYAGHWSCFCGAIEEGETPLQCAVRELKEETGFDFPEKNFEYVGTLERLSIFKYEVQNILTPDLCYEHTESGWFKKSKLSVLPTPIDEKLISLLK